MFKKSKVEVNKIEDALGLANGAIEMFRKASDDLSVANSILAEAIAEDSDEIARRQARINTAEESIRKHQVIQSKLNHFLGE